MALFFIRLLFRGGLFALALLGPGGLEAPFGPRSGPSLVNVMWAAYFVCIVLKLIPTRRSVGRNKFLTRNYAPVSPPPTAERLEAVRREQNRGAIQVAVVWLSLNAVLFGLYFAGLLKGVHMVLISLFYFVADLICIGFFCPFQVLFMKNRCCVSCRIYSWDALMMVTPLVVLNTLFSWSLVAMALVVFLRWELAFLRFPERFSHVSNGKLGCKDCTEHSCRIKKPGGMGLFRGRTPGGRREKI